MNPSSSAGWIKLANSPIEVSTRFFKAEDGVELAWHEAGEGWPVMLIHGLFSSAAINWVKYCAAAEIASRGFRLIMPDLRAHGDSAAPHDPARYPPDVLVEDGFALVRHLGLEAGAYDLGGYSLGARTSARMIVRGAKPRKAIIAGMGLHGMLDTRARAEHFRNVLKNFGQHQRGTEAWMAAQFLKTTGGDPQALLPLLDSFLDTSEDELRAITTPALVLSGEDDHDNGSARELAEMVPGAVYAAIPGNHMSAVTRPELGRAIVDFLMA